MKQFIFVLTTLTLLFSCSTTKIAGNYTFKTECFGVEQDGSQTVKAWGTGRNRFDAIEQAKKNAVKDVIFSGITEGKQECQVRPLIVEVNAREKYEDYFNSFFADNGKYIEFVSLKDERIGQKIKRDRLKSREGVTHGVVLRILRSQLKTQLKNDGILK